MIDFPAGQVASWAAYVFLCSPLRSYPGPFFAKFSSLWIVAQCRRARRSKAVFNLHKKYGDFVRIAPNHILIADTTAVQEIYSHKSGFTKGPFYEDKYVLGSMKKRQLTSIVILPFHQVEPVLFNTRNVQIHQRKKKIMNPAFSARNLRDFEPHMSENIRKLMNCIRRQLDSSKSTKLDFNVYCKLFHGRVFLLVNANFYSKLPGI
jgi:benzoate 4-monooxygenase